MTSSLATKLLLHPGIRLPSTSSSRATPKFAAMAIKKNAELGWKPVHILHSVSQSTGSVMKPAGLENGKGVISANYGKDPDDPSWKDDKAVQDFFAFMDKYVPDGDKHSTLYVYGYNAAQTMVQVLKQAGDNLTRENIMKQAASLKDFVPDTLLPGVKINTSATDFYPIDQLQIMQFKGEKYELQGPIITGGMGGS